MEQHNEPVDDKIAGEHRSDVNWNDLPPELMTKIFSYVSQFDLVNTMSKVSLYWLDLSTNSQYWKTVCFEEIFKSCPQFLNYFHNIQSSVEKLVISSASFQKLAESKHKFQFILLSDLSVLHEIKWSKSVENLVLSCPKLRNVEFQPRTWRDIEKSMLTLQNVQLKSFHLTYLSNDLTMVRNRFLDFMMRQNHLDNFSLTSSHEEDVHIVSAILDHCVSIKDLTLSNEFSLKSPFLTETKTLNLTYVTVHSPLFSDEGVESLVQRCPNLEYLNLETSIAITDESLRHISIYCFKLESLLVGCNPPINGPDITGNGLVDLAKCKTLSTVSFKGCRKISDNGVACLVHALANLKCIRLTGCLKVGNPALVAIADSCGMLESANFHKNCKIAVEGAIHFVCECKNLKYLDLSSCVGIADTGDSSSFQSHESDHEQRVNANGEASEQDTDTDRGKFKETDTEKKNISKLKVLNMQRCTKLSKTLIYEILKYCPNIEKLYLTTGNDIGNVEFVRDTFKMCRQLQVLTVLNRTFRRSKVESMMLTE